MVTSDSDLYRRSSQYRLWSFTREQLLKKVHEANRRVPPTEFSLNANEEREIVIFFASVQTKALCDVFGLPSQVRATSTSYFRKFYLHYSVMEYHPKLILSTCVFLAAKSENAYIPIQTFAESLENIEPQEILDLEFLLFKTLDFTLQVHNPLRPLHGFFLDMQNVLDNYAQQDLASIHDSAKKIIIDSFVSDANFLFTPTQIALAALMQTNELATTEYMAHAMYGPNASLEKLLAIVNDCMSVMSVEPPLPQACKPARKKLNQYYKLLAAEGPDKKRARLS